MTPQGKAGGKSKAKETSFFDILKQDHDNVKNMFEQIEEDEEGENREEMFAGLRSELQEHMQLEENFFYPVMEQSEDLRDMALEAYEEHHVAKTILSEFSGLDFDDDRWHAKMKVLQEVVNHHIQEEEKNIFKSARKALETDQISEITNQIREHKRGMEKKAA